MSAYTEHIVGSLHSAHWPAIMEYVKEQIGLAAWNAMSGEEAPRKYKTFRDDCW